MVNPRSPKARAEAQRLLEECNITRPEEIDLETIAAANNVEVAYADIDGATASVLRVAERARIRISSRIHDVGWRRFTVVHEIGHLRCGHVVADADAHGAGRTCKPNKDRSLPEREANVFATEVLMPEPMVRRHCCVSHATLTSARAIAQRFTTSVLASALRFVELTDECCALAYSSLGRVQWVKRSETFPDWIPRGRALDHRSAAFDYDGSGVIDDAPQLIAADAWIPQNKVDTLEQQIVEHSAVIAPLGVVFSMLWIPRGNLQHIDLAS